MPGPCLHSTVRAKWGIPPLSLGTYLKFWSVVCYCVTFWLALFKKEESCLMSSLSCCFVTQFHVQDKEPVSDTPMSLKDVYATIWTICKLKRKDLFNCLGATCLNTYDARHTMAHIYPPFRKNWIRCQRSRDFTQNGRKGPETRRSGYRCLDRFSLPNNCRMACRELVTGGQAASSLGHCFLATSVLYTRGCINRLMVPKTSTYDGILRLFGHI